MSFTHHKFVNTTPKPNATKKSRGELVGPLAGCVDIAEVGVAEVEEAVCAVDVLVCAFRARR